jgi:hypothetical protein
MKQRHFTKNRRKERISSFILFFLALLVSGALILSMPALSALIKGDMFKPKKRELTTIQVKKVDLEEKKPKPKREERRPERTKPNDRTIKSGPRFAMNLDVAGTGGVNVSLNLVNKSRGDGGTGAGDVDKKPSPVGRMDMEVPEKVREQELDASVTLMFCVDATGRAYDIRVINEDPSGLGMAQGGISAISNISFEPAYAGKEAVAFCGMEKEFIFKFSE